MQLFPETDQGQMIAFGVGTLALGALMTWADGGLDRWLKKKPEAEGEAATAGFGQVAAAANSYAHMMAQQGVPPLGVQQMGRHMLVHFPPQAHNDVWGRAQVAEGQAAAHGVFVALVTGPPNKCAVVFTEHPRRAEAVLMNQGWTKIEPSPRWR